MERSSMDSFSLAVSPPLLPQATPKGSATVAPLFDEERCGGWGLGATNGSGSTTAFGDEPFALSELIASLPMSAAYPIDASATSPQRYRRGGPQQPFVSSPASTDGDDNGLDDDVEGTFAWGAAAPTPDTLTTAGAVQDNVLSSQGVGVGCVRNGSGASRSYAQHPHVGGGGVVQVSELLQSASSTRTTPVKLPHHVGADLNMPPPAWLRGGCNTAVDHLGPTNPWDPVSSTFAMVDVVANLIESQDAGCSVFDGGWRSHPPPHQSFFAASGLASDVPLPEVPDVVCPAEQLKRILKANINGSPLAFVAHRIGPSVVIEGNPQPQPVQTVKEARNRALKSKLLYFSVLAANDDDAALSSTDSKNDGQAAPPDASASELPSDGSSLKSFEQSPRGEFRKCLHWQFDDLSVLLGANTPTVSLPSHPGKELTLQLVNLDGRQRNAAQQPLLTRDEALDVWLDTIMSNVDGVALCYHTDGVVEGCQVVSTANIPSLAADSFAPIAVQREARNVLRWLTTACAKTGGSYVVIKEAHGSTLRLYDISSFGPSEAACPDLDRADAPADDTSSPCGAADAPPPSSIGVGSVVTPLELQSGPASTQPAPHRHAVAAPLSDAANNSPLPLDDASTSGLCAIDDELVTPKQSETQRSRLRKGTSVMGQEARLRWRRRRDMFQTFSFPVAMMCLRMAQALRNSDAETLRLLEKTISLLEDGEVAATLSDSDVEDHRDAAVANAVRARVTFPLAKAHAMCMHHFHSSSPLQDAEALCLHHANRSLHYCGILCDATLEWIIAEFPTTGAAVDDTISNNSGKKRLRFLQAQDAEVDSIVGEVIRCAAAVASQQVKTKATFLEALEAVSICQQGLWLRRYFIPPCMTTSGALYDMSDSPWLRWTDAVHRFVAVGQKSDQRTVARRQDDVAAALLQLETLLGDMCWNCAVAMKPQPEPAASPSSTMRSANSTISRSLALLGHYNREGPLAVAQAKRGIVGGTGLDFVSRVLPLPTDRHKLLELAETAFRRATVVAQVLGMRPRFQQRKCAGIVAEQAHALMPPTIQQIQQKGALASDCAALGMAARKFDEAAHLFLEAEDLVNALMMAINHSKMLVRHATLLMDGPSPTERASCEGMRLLMEAAVNVEALLGQCDAHQAGASPPHSSSGNDEWSRVVSLTCSHLVNLYLMCFQRLAAASGAQLAQGPLAGALSGTLSAAVKRFSDDPATAASPAVSQHDAPSTDADWKGAESALYRWFLLPGYKLAKRGNVASLELHLLKVGYTFHMSCAGLTSLSVPLQIPWPYESLPTAARVDSARFAAARCRQYLARLGTSTTGSQSVWEDCLSALLASCDLVATYAFLLKHAQVLAALASEQGPDGDNAHTPSNSSEAEVDLIERALTSVCSVAPLVSQIAEMLDAHALKLFGRSDSDLNDLLGALHSIHTSVSAVAMYLLRQLKANTAASRKPDAVRAIARHAAVAASATIKVGTVASARAALQSCQMLLDMLDDLFDGKRKKQVSRFL